MSTGKPTITNATPGTVTATSREPRLERAAPADLAALMGWFADRTALARWGGPAMRWPLGATSFREDLQLEHAVTQVFRSRDGELLAFGQYYPKLGRCHLARVAVAPGWRGGGLGRRFVRALMDRGRMELGVAACSLYVLEDNVAALHCYLACGFVPAEDPEPLPLIPECLFMVAEPRAAG